MEPAPRRAFPRWLATILVMGVILGMLAGPSLHRRDRPPQASPEALAAPILNPENSEPPPPHHRLRIMTYNIQHGADAYGRVDLTQTTEAIGRFAPDILFLAEVDQGWRRSGFVDQPAELARSLGMPYVHFAPALTTRSIVHTSPGTTARYGNLFLSKLPVKESGAVALPRKGANEPRNVLWIDVEFAGQTIRVFGTHLSVDGSERVQQFRALADLIAASPHPAVVLGDLNSPPSRLKDEAPYLGSPPWHDAHVVLGQGDGFTFPSPSPRSRIDYIFVHASLLPQLVSTTVVQSAASDHLPIFVELSPKPRMAQH